MRYLSCLSYLSMRIKTRVKKLLFQKNKHYRRKSVQRFKNILKKFAHYIKDIKDISKTKNLRDEKTGICNQMVPFNIKRERKEKVNDGTTYQTFY